MPIITKPDSYTKLLIHSDTSDGSTTFTDSSAGSHTITAVGTARHDDAQYKFGASAIELDGNSDYLSIPVSSDWGFGAGDFTIDFWWRIGESDNEYRICGQYETQWRFWRIEKRAHNDTKGELSFRWDYGPTDTIQTELSFHGENSPTLVWTDDTWYHIAMVRHGTYSALYRDGIMAASRNDQNPTLTSINSALEIGRQGGSSYVDGHMDEIRISKGIARWTDSFVPPNKPYSVIDDDFVTDVSGIQGGARDSSTKISSDMIILSDPDEASTDNVFSVSDKDANNLMSIRADGIITKPYLPAFHAYINGVTEDSTHGTITFNATSYNIGNHYNTSTYTFTAPVDGIYSFTLNVGLDGIIDSTNYFGFNFVVGGVQSQWQFIWENSKAQDYWSKCTTREFQMDASDTCYISLSGSGTGQFSSMRTGAHDSTFSGHLIG